MVKRECSLTKELTVLLEIKKLTSYMPKDTYGLFYLQHIRMFQYQSLNASN